MSAVFEIWYKYRVHNRVWLLWSQPSSRQIPHGVLHILTSIQHKQIRFILLANQPTAIDPYANPEA